MSFYPLIISLFLFQSLANSSQNTTSIGVTIDVNSETGKQHRTAMQIAAQSFNIHYNNQNLVIFFRDSGRNPLQAASVAEELITKEKVKVIIGMETWQEAALVADLGAKFQVPIISFSSPPSVPSSLVQLRWPFLIQMSQNLSAQMNFIADMIHAFNSQKVIVIYEDNPYSSESGMLSLLSEALEKFNLQIEYLLALPPFTSLSDPKGFVLDELLKLLPLKSRVFVVLQASLPEEKINSNSARVVVGVWLFLVFVLTSSYTANLSSLLTVQKLRSDRDIEWLKQNNLSVGCDNTSTFVKDYLIQVYKFSTHQVVEVGDEQDTLDKFKNKKISALFAESPYEKVFLNKYCKEYTSTTAAYKFGGLGFVFQKDDPMAKDFSEAILTLAENGKLKDLENIWLTPSNKCSNNSPSPEETESLTLDKFWGLYVICAATSTICLLLALLKKRLRNHNHYEEADQLPQGSVISESDDDNNNNSQRAIRVGTGLNIENLIKLNKSATFGGRVKEGVRRRNSPKLESISISDEQGDLPHSQSAAMP